MADSLMKNLRKKTLRTKESLRETFGKADRTTDEQFEESCNEFTKQQKNVERLQKELKNYATCLKALSTASNGLNEAIREIYEAQWEGIEHVKANTHSLDLIWDDYLEKINEDALNPLNIYCNKFIDLRAKIAKRGRKLVDYDAARHAYNSIQSSAKKDDAKIQKAKEQLNIAKKLYDDLNNELLVALPELYDSRIDFFLNNFKTIFTAEHAFHDETAKLDKDLLVEMNKVQLNGNEKINLPNDSLKKPQDSQPVLLNSPSKIVPDSNPSPKPAKAPRTFIENQIKQSPLVENGKNLVGKDSKMAKNYEGNSLYPEIPKESSPLDEKNPFNENEEVKGLSKNGSKIEQNVLSVVPEEPSQPNLDQSKITNDAPADDVISQLSDPSKGSSLTPRGSPINQEQPDNAPEPAPAPPSAPAPSNNVAHVKSAIAHRRVLYKAQATHRYSAEDTDELTFDAGEVLLVVEPDDPDELDEGWLAGVKESTGESGVFPANFTKPF